MLYPVKDIDRASWSIVGGSILPRARDLVFGSTDRQNSLECPRRHDLDSGPIDTLPIASRRLTGQPRAVPGLFPAMLALYISCRRPSKPLKISSLQNETLNIISLKIFSLNIFSLKTCSVSASIWPRPRAGACAGARIEDPKTLLKFSKMLRQRRFQGGGPFLKRMLWIASLKSSMSS